MPYTSYNAYIVQSNFFVILGLVVVNHLASIFNLKPLLVLLQWTYFQIAEILLIGACCYNMYNVSRDLIDPYITNIHIPYGKYIFAPGPIVTIVFRLLHLIFSSILPSKKSTSAATSATASTATKTAPQKQDDITNVNDIFTNFLSSNTTTTAPQPGSVYFNFATANQAQQPAQQQQQGIINARHIIQPQTALSFNLTDQSSLFASETIISRHIPKLKYTPCIKPPLEPSAHRERILWYLSPTPEVVDDFRIEQILGYQKHWHNFNDRYSRDEYDKLTAALLKYIFTPLSSSIETIDKKLAPKHTIATCPQGIVALSYLMPEFNQDTVFTMAEVLKFLTLNGHNSPESIQYVSERVKELASNKKMAAYTYTPKSTGMPTDSAIIMHIFTTYLNMKEPYAIPPLVPAQIDLFKFLLIYVYMTPELEHWKVFEK